MFVKIIFLADKQTRIPSLHLYQYCIRTYLTNQPHTLNNLFILYQKLLYGGPCLGWVVISAPHTHKLCKRVESLEHLYMGRLGALRRNHKFVFIWQQKYGFGIYKFITIWTIIIINLTLAQIVRTRAARVYRSKKKVNASTFSCLTHSERLHAIVVRAAGNPWTETRETPPQYKVLLKDARLRVRHTKSITADLNTLKM